MQRKRFYVKILLLALMVFLTLTLVGCSTDSENSQGNSGADSQFQTGDFSGSPGRQFGQQSPEEIKKSLKVLIDNKTITQKQLDEVVAFLQKQAEERSKNNQGYKGPRPGGQNFGGPRSGNQGQRPNPLSELVTKKTITQEQADKIMEVMFQGRGMNRSQGNKTSNF